MCEHQRCDGYAAGPSRPTNLRNTSRDYDSKTAGFYSLSSRRRIGLAGRTGMPLQAFELPHSSCSPCHPYFSGARPALYCPPRQGCSHPHVLTTMASESSNLAAAKHGQNGRAPEWQMLSPFLSQFLSRRQSLGNPKGLSGRRGPTQARRQIARRPLPSE